MKVGGVARGCVGEKGWVCCAMCNCCQLLSRNEEIYAASRECKVKIFLMHTQAIPLRAMLLLV